MEKCYNWTKRFEKIHEVPWKPHQKPDNSWFQNEIQEEYERKAVKFIPITH